MTNLPDAFARARQKFDGHPLLDADQDAAARWIGGEVLRRAPLRSRARDQDLSDLQNRCGQK